jgi:hypothetical protein
MNADEAVEQVYRHIAARLTQGASAAEVEKDLTDMGFDAEVANTAIASVQGAMRAAKKKAANKNILLGALWCGGGVLVTAFTYSAASSSSGGGHYVVAWGAIVFGGIQLFRGLAQAAG